MKNLLLGIAIGAVGTLVFVSGAVGFSFAFGVAVYHRSLAIFDWILGPNGALLFIYIVVGVAFVALALAILDSLRRACFEVKWMIRGLQWKGPRSKAHHDWFWYGELSYWLNRTGRPKAAAFAKEQEQAAKLQYNKEHAERMARLDRQIAESERKLAEAAPV